MSQTRVREWSDFLSIFGIVVCLAAVLLAITFLTVIFSSI
jgi:hypothetical protein